MGCAVDCAKPLEEVEAYGDISGIGVLLSFLLTAFMLVTLVIGYYVTVYQPRDDPFRHARSEGSSNHIPNSIDDRFLIVLRALLRTTYRKLRLGTVLPEALKLDRASVEEALIKCAKTFSDIQICTGIALMISGFKSFSCGLQLYHWQLIIYMAWLATVTHASLLSLLRSYLLNHRTQLWWRFAGMFIVLVMFIVAVTITPHFTWTYSENYAGYAKCPAPSETSDSESLESKLKLSFFIIWGFIVRFLKLFRRFHDAPQQLSFNLRNKSMLLQHGQGGISGWNPFKKCGKKQRFKIMVLDPLFIAFYRTLHLQLDFLTSFFFEVLWVTASFVWATKRLIALRVAFSPPAENEWAFGQVFPLVLLAAPLAAFMDFFPLRSSLRRHPDVSLTQDTESGSNNETDIEIAACSEEAAETYETSVSFHGGSVIVGISYVHLVLYILIIDYIGISDALELLAFTFVLFYPVLHATWVVYELWLSRLFPKKKHSSVVLDMLFLLIIFLLSTQMMHVLYASPTFPEDEEPDRLPVNNIWTTSHSIKLGAIDVGTASMAILFLAYCAFVGWATLHVRWKEKRHQDETPTQRSWSRRLAMASSMLLALSIFAIVFTLGGPEPIAIAMPAVLFLQILLLLFDFAAQRTRLGDQLWIKNGICVFLVAVSIILPCVSESSRPLYFMPPMSLVAAVICTCPIWVACYISYEAVQSRRNGPKIVTEGQAT